MKQLKYCLLALLWPAMNGLAQTPLQKIPALTIGDQLPDLVMTNLYNYPSAAVHLSSLKGKMIILDFWSTWCASCIAAFPKMHRLQKEFDGQLQVFLVNTYEGDSIKKVKPFFDRRTAGTGEKVTLPYSLLQTGLSPYFPYRFIPHYVWIDQTGKVVAITSQFEVTSQNIRSALAGNTAGIHTKNDLLDFDNRKPLFVQGNGGEGNEFLYRSIFTGYVEGVGNVSGIVRTPEGKITRIYLINNSPLGLLRMAYPDKLELPYNRIITEAKNGYQFKYGSTEDSLMYKNACCYDLSIPPATIEETVQYMQQDIFRIYHVRVKSEVRNLHCILLKIDGTGASPLTKGGKETIFIAKTSPQKYLQNQPLTVLAEILNDHPALKQLPVITGQEGTQRIDLVFPPGFDEMDEPALKAFLKNAGLLVTPQESPLNVAVISDE